MNIWRVMYWSPLIGTFNWPEAYGWVPGNDWFEAVENARTLWGLSDANTISAVEVRLDREIH